MTNLLYTLLVTCCDHPENEYDWIPNTVWASYWFGDDVHRTATVMISQIVPIASDDPELRRPRRLLAAADGEGPSRERIRESCAGCGLTITMRDDTWDELSRRLETLEGVWRDCPWEDGPPSVEATISLAMLIRLAQEQRGRKPR